MNPITNDSDGSTCSGNSDVIKGALLVSSFNSKDGDEEIEILKSSFRSPSLSISSEPALHRAMTGDSDAPKKVKFDMSVVQHTETDLLSMSESALPVGKGWDSQVPFLPLPSAKIPLENSSVPLHVSPAGKPLSQPIGVSPVLSLPVSSFPSAQPLLQSAKKATQSLPSLILKTVVHQIDVADPSTWQHLEGPELIESLAAQLDIDGTPGDKLTMLESIVNSAKSQVTPLVKSDEDVIPEQQLRGSGSQNSSGFFPSLFSESILDQDTMTSTTLRRKTDPDENDNSKSDPQGGRVSTEPSSSGAGEWEEVMRAVNNEIVNSQSRKHQREDITIAAIRHKQPPRTSVLPLSKSGCQEMLSDGSGRTREAFILSNDYHGSTVYPSTMTLPIDQVSDLCNTLNSKLQSKHIKTTTKQSATTADAIFTIKTISTKLRTEAVVGDVYLLFLIGMPCPKGSAETERGFSYSTHDGVIEPDMFEDLICAIPKGVCLYIINDVVPGTSCLGELNCSLLSQPTGAITTVNDPTVAFSTDYCGAVFSVGSVMSPNCDFESLKTKKLIGIPSLSLLQSVEHGPCCAGTLLSTLLMNYKSLCFDNKDLPQPFLSSRHQINGWKIKVNIPKGVEYITNNIPTPIKTPITSHELTDQTTPPPSTPVAVMTPIGCDIPEEPGGITRVGIKTPGSLPGCDSRVAIDSVLRRERLKVPFWNLLSDTSTTRSDSIDQSSTSYNSESDDSYSVTDTVRDSIMNPIQPPHGSYWFPSSVSTPQRTFARPKTQFW